MSPKPVWFITASSSGFGSEIAHSALRLGHTVVATARNVDTIADLKSAGAHTLSFDVTSSPEDIASLAADVFSRFGRVDYLINAAGYILQGAIEETTPQEVQDCFNVNVLGTVNTIRAFLPHLRKQELGENGFRATVATFGSLASWTGGADYSVYAMAKVSCSMLAESLAHELQPFKIRATAIEPGYFRTGFLTSSAKQLVKGRLDVYEDGNTPTGQMREFLPQVNGKQPGDVKKGGAVCVEVLTGTGRARGRELPVRVVLGTDCDGAVRQKCKDSLGILDGWKEVVASTDYPKGE